MPTLPIPFVPLQESGSEPLAGASPVAMNVVLDGKGAVRRRPGIAAYSGAPSSVIDSDGIEGLYVTAGGILYAVGSGAPGSSIYAVTAGGAANLSAGPGTDLRGGRRPVIAETEALLVLAAGAEIQKVDLATYQSARLGGSPPTASHVIANASRLLSNDMTVRSRVRYSDQAAGSSIEGHETWDTSGTSGFFSAESRPDPIVALHENTNEVFAFGSTTVQGFAPDPANTYATVMALEHGCAAPYSVVKIDQRFAWLDDRGRFVLSDGRGAQVVSSPAIQQTLHDMATTSDCRGYRVHHGPVDCLVWTFPTDGRTFVYQLGGGWSQWSGWDDGSNNWLPFSVTAHHQRPGSAENLVGTSAGRIGVLKASASDDLGTRINAHVTTGFLNRGTDRRKHCQAVRFAFKRGFAASSTTATAFFSYRDDYGPWENDMPISIGGSGDFIPVEGPRSLGTYRRREWRFTFSNSDELVLVGATEDYDVLEV